MVAAVRGQMNMTGLGDALDDTARASGFLEPPDYGLALSRSPKSIARKLRAYARKLEEGE